MMECAALITGNVVAPRTGGLEVVAAEVPVWLLDIDGVVNAFESLGEDRFETAIAKRFTITWDRTLTDRLHALHTSGRVEIRWLTTWGADANAYIAPLFCWTEFLVCGEVEYGVQWWKLRHAMAVIESEGRRVIWTDDDIRYDETALAWLATLPAARVTWLAPDPARGLSHDDLDAIDEWIGSE